MNAALDAVLGGFWLVHAGCCLGRPLQYTPDDAFFYYQVAFAASLGQGFAFTDVTPTNGFHPLWAWVCTILAALSDGKAELLMLASVAVVALNGCTLFLLRRFIHRHLDDPIPAAPVLLGAPFLLFTGFGMEAALCRCLFVALLFAAHRALQCPNAERILRCAAVAGLVVAARLDLVLLIAPLAILIAHAHLATSRLSFRALCTVGTGVLIGCLPAAPFLVDSHLKFGDPRPISGILKMATAQRLEPSLRVDGIVQLFFAIAVVGALMVAQTPGRPRSKLMAALAAGELAFGVYVWRFNGVELGAWYFACFPIVAAVAGSVISKSGRSWLAERRGTPSGSRTALRWICVVTLVAASTALMFRYGAGAGNLAPHAGGPEGLGAVARRSGVRRALAFDRPGELAYLDDLSVVAADGLTTNLPFQVELEKRGVRWLIERHHIDAIVLPKVGGRYGANLCNATYLNTLRFRCAPDGADIDRVDFVSRLSGAELGSVSVRGLRRLQFSPGRDFEVFLLPRDES